MEFGLLYSIWYGEMFTDAVHRNHDELQILLNTIYMYVCMYWLHAYNRFFLWFDAAVATQQRTKIDWRLRFVLFCIFFLFIIATALLYNCSILLTIICFVLFCFECHLINKNPRISFVFSLCLSLSFKYI